MLKRVFLVLLFSFMFSGCNLVKGKSGIEIISFPSAKVYIDGTEAGMTPYKNNNLTPGKMMVKLVSKDQEWEREVKLVKNANTVIDWEFGEDKEASGGYILYMEETGDSKKTGLIVSSIPDRAAVSIDGEIKGLSPLKLDEIGEGDKQVKISFPGHKSIDVFIRSVRKYRLIVEAVLGREKVVEKVVEEESDLVANVQEVLILETGTGWLRTREASSSASLEKGRVLPGEKYPLVEEGEEWTKILVKGEEVWVSSQYVSKI